MKQADGLIAHNPVMKSVLVDKGISEKKIVSLGIFDYLIPNYQDKEDLSKEGAIIVAGNLAQEKQVTYMSCLQDRHITFMVLVLMRLESYQMKPILVHFFQMNYRQR